MQQVTEIPAPLDRHVETVLPEWQDGNGHMNVAYYLHVFDRGVDVLFDFLGLGAAYRVQTGCSLFTLEQHLVYLSELRVGDQVRVTSQIVDCDAKRLHYFQRMVDAATGRVAATCENLSIHTDLKQRRTALFPAASLAWLAAVKRVHAALPRPAELGRAIGVRQGRPGA
jgi:acyl-CoA thioester hydrolase